MIDSGGALLSGSSFTDVLCDVEQWDLTHGSTVVLVLEFGQDLHTIGGNEFSNIISESSTPLVWISSCWASVRRSSPGNLTSRIGALGSEL